MKLSTDAIRMIVAAAGAAFFFVAGVTAQHFGYNVDVKEIICGQRQQ